MPKIYGVRVGKMRYSPFGIFLLIPIILIYLAFKYGYISFNQSFFIPTATILFIISLLKIIFLDYKNQLTVEENKISILPFNIFPVKNILQIFEKSQIASIYYGGDLPPGGVEVSGLGKRHGSLTHYVIVNTKKGENFAYLFKTNNLPDFYRDLIQSGYPISKRFEEAGKLWTTNPDTLRLSVKYSNYFSLIFLAILGLSIFVFISKFFF